MNSSAEIRTSKQSSVNLRYTRAYLLHHSCLLSISEDKDVFIIIQQKKRSGELLSCRIILKHNKTQCNIYQTISPSYKMNYDMWSYLTVLTVAVVTCYFLSFYYYFFLFLIIFIILLFNYSSEKVTCHTTHSLMLSYSVTWPEMILNISAM